MRRQVLLFALALLSLSASGCAHLNSAITAHLMVSAPNHVDCRIRMKNKQLLKSQPGPFDQRFMVPVGPSPAVLLVSVIDAKPRNSPPVGTILLLHGAYGRSEDMAGTASRFAAIGYRTVLVDLRGHGYSTGDRITYGVQESKDLSQVLDFLQQSGLVEGSIGVYGVSYGAATAIQLASRDDRVRVVVAVAPFSSLRQAAGHLMKTRLPCASLYVTEQWTDQTLHDAGRRGGVDLQEANPKDAIQQTEAMVLLVHGTADDYVEPKHSMELHASAPDHSHVALIEGADHRTAVRDITGVAASLGADWFNRWLRHSDARRRENG